MNPRAMANLDDIGWERALSQFRFASPSFHGKFEFDAKNGTVEGSFDDVILAPLQYVFRVSRLEYRNPDRNVLLIPAIAAEAVIQQPHLVVPLTFDDPHGFAATQRITVRKNSLECEVRLTTTHPVDLVAIETSVRSEPLKPIFGEDRTDDILGAVDPKSPRSGRIAALGNTAEPFACLFVDLGDRGRLLTPTRGLPGKSVGGIYDTLNAGAIRIEFFHRPLEKGVILVGRASLRPWVNDKAELRRQFDEWFAETPFL